MNTIIGGKSTGKSLLLHFIAATLGEKDKKDYDKNFSKSGFEVEFADGETFSLKDTTKQRSRNITYISQQQLQNIVQGDNVSQII